ncbi:hypothetical protein STEG23_031026, partial [Scotinomys teguina]
CWGFNLRSFVHGHLKFESAKVPAVVSIFNVPQRPIHEKGYKSSDALNKVGYGMRFSPPSLSALFSQVHAINHSGEIHANSFLCSCGLDPICHVLEPWSFLWYKSW